MLRVIIIIIIIITITGIIAIIAMEEFHSTDVTVNIGI